MANIIVAGVVNVRMACPVVATGTTASGIRLPGGLDVRLSGTGFGVAHTALALGSRVTLATYLGEDLLGLMAEQGLRQAGIHSAGVRTCAEQPRALVRYDEAGGRHNISDLRSTPGLSYPVPVFDSLVDEHGCDLAVLTNIGFSRALIPAATGRGIPFVTDMHVVREVDSPHNREWMASAHVLACSHEGLAVSPAEWVRAMWSTYRTEVVIIGCGSAGAVIGVHEDRSIWHVDAIAPRGVSYTSGAGDALIGSFSHHFADSGDPVHALRRAVLTAGWCVGGTPDGSRHPNAALLASLQTHHGLPPARRLA